MDDDLRELMAACAQVTQATERPVEQIEARTSEDAQQPSAALLESESGSLEALQARVSALEVTLVRLEGALARLEGRAPFSAPTEGVYRLSGGCVRERDVTYDSDGTPLPILR